MKQLKMTGPQHAAFRRLLESYSDDNEELTQECEQCAQPATEYKKIRLVTPHKEQAFVNVKNRGFDMNFLTDLEKATFQYYTEEALIEEVYELGDYAWLCLPCAKLWVKAHHKVEEERESA